MAEEEAATLDITMNTNDVVEKTSEYKIFDEESQQQQIEGKSENKTSTERKEKYDDCVSKSTETSSNNSKKWRRRICWVTIIAVLIVLIAIGPKIDALGYKKSGNSNKCTDDMSTLVGMDSERAIECLESQYPNFQIVAVEEGSMVTMDYRMDRIRVYTDSQGRVATTPNIG